MLEVARALLILLVFSLHSTAVYSIDDDDDHSDNTNLPPHCTIRSIIRSEIICENEIPDFDSYNQTFLDTIEKLKIHRCPFVTLKPDSFHNLRQLEALIIDCDKVQVRGDGPAFLHLPRLWQLSIGKNVVAFPPAFFCQLNSVGYLTLSHNNISSEEGFGAANCSGGGGGGGGGGISPSFDASHNNLTSISNITFFCNHENWSILNLNYNAIESIAEGALARIHYLSRLHLRGNLIKELPVDLFKFARFLSFLDLSNNQLSHLPVDIFKFARNLGILNLSNNQLSHLPVDIFQPLHSVLRDLSLSGNLFTTLNVASFASLSHLRHLDLSNNRLKNVDNFYQHPHLENLDVSGNQLETIDARTLRGLNTSIWLNFSRNAIRTIAENVFVNCTRITYLDLSYNRLKDGLKFRMKDWFYDLRLDHNEIEEFNATDFDFDTGISFFSLSYNKITSLGPKAFASFHKLYTLDVSHNRIETIDDSAFDGLHSLTKLDLSGNRISGNLDHRMFKGPFKLSKLDLSFNQLSSIDEHLLEDLKSLYSLNLESNQLTNSPVWTIFSEATVSSIAIGGNPWSCQCPFVIPFKHFLASHWRLIVNAQQLYCKHEPLSDDVILLHTFNVTHCDQLPLHSIVNLNNEMDSCNVATNAVLGVFLSVTVVVLGICLFAFRMEIKMALARRISTVVFKK